MPDEVNQASSAAQTADATDGASNLQLNEAAALLFTKSKTTPPPKSAQAAEQVTQGAESASKDSQTESAAEDENSQAEPTDETDLAETDTDADEKASEEADDDVLSQNRQGLDDKTKQKIQKRIDKITARAKTAESRIAELENALKAREQQAQQQPAYVPPSDLPPNIAQIQDFKALEEKKREAKEAIRWAERQLDAESEGESLPEGWSRKALKDAIRAAKVAQEDHLPAREDFLRRRAQSLNDAYKVNPALQDRNSADYMRAQAILRSDPYLANHWNAATLIATQIEGEKALQARAQSAAKEKEKPAAKKIPAAKPASDQTAVSGTGGGSRSPGATAAKQMLESKRAEFGSKGGVSANEAAQFLLQRDKVLQTR